MPGSPERMRKKGGRSDMRKRRREVRGKTVSAQMRRVLVISALLILLDIAVSILVMRDVRSEACSYLSDMTELYVKEQDRTFFRLGRQMLSILIGNEGTKSEINKQLNILEESEDPLEKNVATLALRNYFLEYTWEYGAEYYFFAYLEKSGSYVNLSDSGDSVSGMEGCLRELLANGSLDGYSAKSEWTCIALPTGNYLTKVMYNRGRYLGCYIRADCLIEPLADVSSSTRNFYVLADEEHQVAAGSKLSERQEGELQEYLKTGKSNSLFCSFVIEKNFERAPFEVLVFIDSFGIFEKYFAIQMALLILGAAILGALSFIMAHVQKKVLRPIQEFADNLKAYDDSDHLVFDITSNELKELEQANEQFRDLLRQIKKLKITLYENEVNEQKIRMDYLQLQIKPHFYLNCLNLICQMIDLGQETEARRMAVLASDYLRYLFSESLELVEISSELIHTESYLEIQKIRYGDAFTYYIEQDEETKNCLILPLVIQTFAENAVCHTVSLDSSVDITITVCMEEEDEEKAVHISISDTGQGFPGEVLAKLQAGQELEKKEGHRIGITNCLKRIKYFYKEKAQVQFYNNPLGGAVVEIFLPMTVSRDQ